MESIAVDEDNREQEEEEKKVPTGVKINHYKEMGLEDTSILKKIAGQVGFQLGKKGKKDNASPKAGSKNKSASKSNTAKKKTGQSAAMDMATSMATKQFSVEEDISQPVFRYIPDRATIQRLITRCSNMKGDIDEILNQDAEDGPAEQEGGTLQSTI